MRAGLDKNVILKAAADMADKHGVANVTLKALADELGVKPPSLYKHIDGLDELNKELMLYGWKTLESDLIRSAVGKAKDDAIRAIFHTYRNYVIEHPGLFEAMQWYNMYLSDEYLQVTEEIVSLLFQILDSYNLPDEKKVHLVRIFRGFLQGFLSIECHGGYGNPMPIEKTFDFALDILLSGIHGLQETTDKSPSFRKQDFQARCQCLQETTHSSS